MNLRDPVLDGLSLNFRWNFATEMMGLKLWTPQRNAQTWDILSYLGWQFKILKVVRSTRRDTPSARFFYAGNYDIPKILPCLLPLTKWHPRRSTCCSSTEMFSFLPAFKNILVHLTTLAVKIQVTNQTGKLFELPVAPVGFTPPYPACNRHHQDLTVLGPGIPT